MVSEPFPPTTIFFSFSPNLAGRYPSIILTRHGKAAAMEDQAKLLADLTAAVSSMNAKLDEMHPAVLDLHTWKPTIERSMEALRAEVGDLRSRVIGVTRSTSPSPKGAVLPLPLQFSADAPPASSTPAKPAVVFSSAVADEDGGDGHGQFGHGDASNLRGHVSDDPESSDGSPAKVLKGYKKV